MKIGNNKNSRGADGRYRTISIVAGFFFLLLAFVFFFIIPQEKLKTGIVKPIKVSEESKKKILYVDSYHQDFEWVKEIIKGLLDELKIKVLKDGKLDSSKSRVQLRIVHMDTKRNKSEEFIKDSAQKVKKIIEEWKPDLVIASDDNASKYLIVPFYKNAKLPFVFCGVNWDASVYGYPFDNVTGMVEVNRLMDVINILKKYMKNDKIGIIGSDSLTVRKDVINCSKKFKIDFVERYPKTFNELKSMYLDLQNQCGLVIVEEFESVEGFDHGKMMKFIYKNTKVPTGAMYRSFSCYALLTCATFGEEQGKWAAQTALRILDGEKVSDIPIAVNEKAKIYLNMKLAKELKIVFPIELVERASFVDDE